MNAFGIDTNAPAVASNEVRTLSGITTIKDTVEKAAQLNRSAEGILFVDEFAFRMQDPRESVAKVLA